MNVFANENRVFTGLFFQDSLMKSNFASYPEVILVDATYKLNELRMPVYLMLVIDGNGQSEIVMLLKCSLQLLKQKMLFQKWLKLSRRIIQTGSALK